MGNKYQKAADAVIAALMDRASFDHWWGDIDDEIRFEIKEAMALTIEEEVNRG